MCTVSFIPVRGAVFITSNRDEKLTRRKALPPAFLDYKGSKLLFPKDADAGGTWMVMKENGDTAVLLNGAFICHTSRPPYRKSRGVVLLDIIAETCPSSEISTYDFSGIEPFTIVLFEKNLLYEFRWDGTEKYAKQLSHTDPHIWSSATLYDGFTVKKREEWFSSFLNKTHHPTQQDILNFHRFTGDGDKSNDLLMSRNNIYSTVSITSVMLTDDRGVMSYLDTLDNHFSERKTELARESALL